MMESKLIAKLAATLALVVLMAACSSTPDQPPQPQVEAAPKIPAKADQPPAQEPPPPDPAASQYQLALWSAKAGKTKKAIKQFQKLIDMQPSYKYAHTNLGLLLIQANQMNEAKKVLERAIEQDKSDAIAYNHLAIIQRNDGEFKKAQQNYRKAIKADPEYANAYLNLAILLDIYLQDLSGALSNYQAFQRLSGRKNESIEKWVIDLKRRLDKSDKKTKG